MEERVKNGVSTVLENIQPSLSVGADEHDPCDALDRGVGPQLDPAR
jgi:hypothetical protein